MINNKLIDRNFGVVISVKDNILKVIGMSHIGAGEMVISQSGYIGMVLNLETTYISIIMFDDNVLMSGDKVKRLFTTLSSSVGCFLMGNIYNSIGTMLNQTNWISNYKLDYIFKVFVDMKRVVEVKAPGIIERQPVYEQVNTGILGVDGIMPIGQGQRQLIIGDRQTGKSSIAMMVALNQAGLDLILVRYSFI
jgi:F-type H+-transporting ATPase subunit alpha